MSYDKFISSVNDNRIYKEDVGLWLSLSAAEKAKMIQETKELGTEEDVKYLLEAAQVASQVPEEEVNPFVKHYRSFKKGIDATKKGWDDAREKSVDPLLKVTKGAAKGVEYVGKKLGIKAMSRRGASAQDAVSAGQIARKLGASVDTTEKIGGAVGSGSEAIRKFASEHGGKAAAAAAAGLGALGLVKAIRRKKAEPAAPVSA